MNQDRTKRKLTAIFSADVVGYSRLMEADEAWTIKCLEENKVLISKLIEEYQGRVIDAPGDNLLAEFNSVINAVECGVKIQQELKKKNDHLIESNRMLFRIGINLGDVVEEDGRIYGSGVNIAARLEGLAEPGGICISGRTYDHIKTTLGFGYKFLGEHNVKNITEPIRIYRLLMDAENAGKIIGEKKALSRSYYRMAMLAVVFLIIIAVVSVVWNIYSRKPGETEIITEPLALSDLGKTHKSIAVLPFEDFSPEKDQGYFVDGLSEEILNTIAQIPDLTVIARTSSFSFKGKEKTIQEIANALGVENILEGSVRKEGNNIRITAQLIKAADESHLWSEIYNRELTDIFNVQEDIAVRVADKLKLALGVDKSFKKLGGTNNLEAYEQYLVALGLYQKSDYPQALESINKAIKLDQEFALAWALKGMIHIFISAGVPAERISFEHDAALEAAMKATHLEPELGIAYLSLGTVQMNRGDLLEAGSAFKRGVELTTNAMDYFGFGLTWHYVVVGYIKNCIELFNNGRKNDPLLQGTRMWYMYLLGVIGDLQGAEEEYKHCQKLFGNDLWYNIDMYITMLHLSSKDVLSIEEIPELPMLGPIWAIGRKHIDSPEEGIAELHLHYSNEKTLTNLESAYIGWWAAFFGDSDFALSAMERSSSLWAGGPILIWDPVFREVRQLPRFKKLMKEKGLSDYWKTYGWPDLCHPIGDDDFVCY